MKTRNGFVSNSSSSTFIVAKAYLTEKQIQAILDFRFGKDKDGVYFGDNGNDFFHNEDCYLYFECRNIADDLRKMLDKVGVKRKHYIFIDT